MKWNFFAVLSVRSKNSCLYFSCDLTVDITSLTPLYCDVITMYQCHAVWLISDVQCGLLSVLHVAAHCGHMATYQCRAVWFISAMWCGLLSALHIVAHCGHMATYQCRAVWFVVSAARSGTLWSRGTGWFTCQSWSHCQHIRLSVWTNTAPLSCSVRTAGHHCEYITLCVYYTVCTP